MGFKARELADRECVFLDLDEFGAPCTLDGKAVNAVVDNAERGDRELEMGLSSDALRVFVRTEDSPRRRNPGESILLNDRSYIVGTWAEEMGMSVITLVRAQ